MLKQGPHLNETEGKTGINMLVAICDDEIIWAEKAGKIIIEYAKATFLDLEVISFNGKEDLLNYEGAPIDIIFMDIELGDAIGIEVVKEINRKWKYCQVVYMTNFLYYATEVYTTDHVFFILKDHFQNKIAEVFQKVLHIREQKTKQLHFSVIGGNEVVICPEDILYFERDKRITMIETVWGKYQIWEKMDEIMPKLSEVDFVRCHNSYIVNLSAVREMHKTVFLLKNGTEVVISRSYWKKVSQAFMKWALTQMS